FAIFAYIISHKIKQPSSILTILIGVLIGPSFLSLLEYNNTIHIMARVGSVFLLFLAGLTTNFSEIYNKNSLAVGIIGGILPFIGGIIVGLLFGFDLSVSVFIGAAITATCLGLTTAMLKEIGKLNTQTAKVMFGAAVVDDVVGLIMLSLAITITTGLSIINIVVTILLSFGFIVIATILGTRIIPNMIDAFDRSIGIEKPKLTFMLGISIVLVFAWLAEFIGLAAIVGAFLAGVSMSRSLSARFLHHGGEYLEAVFVPIFLIAIGIAVEVSTLFNMLPFIVTLSIVAIITKFFGCGYAAMKCGMNKRESMIVGMGMAPRGEVAFIISLYGLSLGIIGKDIYTAIVFMSFITTIFALTALKRMYEK
ncbi:MAG: cation:proton antiporter, partial [Candidatus Aenigmatarchaeota archaeon]